MIVDCTFERQIKRQRTEKQKKFQAAFIDDIITKMKWWDYEFEINICLRKKIP